MLECHLYLRRECLLNPSKPATRARAAVAGWLAFLVPKLIESAIGGIAAALKKAGGKETAQIGAVRFASLYLADKQQALSLDPELGCLLALWFESEGPSSKEDDIVKKLRAEKLLPTQAALVGAFEAAIRPSPDATCFHLETRYFCAREFVGDRGKKNRDYVITVSLSTPDATAEGKTFALGTLDLGTVKRSGEIRASDAEGDANQRLRSNLMPWSQISSASKTAYERDVAANEAAGKRYMPVTFSLTVSETADGNQFLLTLGELLGGAAGEIAKDLSKRILPEELAKADAEAAANAAKLYEDEVLAEIDVAKAKKALAVGSAEDKERLQLELELAERRLARRRSLREAAGLPPRS